MASIQVVLLNGTTADANEVMSNFNEIYSDIDQTNIGAANKTGTGKIVLDTSPTITGTPSFSGPPTFNAGITLPTTQRVNLNVGGTTRIEESAPNVFDITVGGNLALSISDTTSARFRNIPIAVDPTERIYLDGVGDTYLYEASSNAPTLVAGGSVVWSVDATQMAIGGSFALAIASGQKLYLDSGGDTYILESSANTLNLYVGGAPTFQSTATKIDLLVDTAVAATKKLSYDGGGDTYDQESSANVLDRYAGGALALRCTASTAVIHTNSTFNTSGELTLGDLSAPSSISAGSRRAFSKAWGTVNAFGNLALGYNCSTVRNAPGTYTITFTTSMSNVNYCVTNAITGGPGYTATVTIVSAASFQIGIVDAAQLPADANFYFSVFGT